MSFLSSAGFLTFVLVIGGLIFVHELGHFLAARRVGVRVEEFGFGFPPRVFGVVRDGSGRWHAFFGNNRPDGRRQSSDGRRQLVEGGRQSAVGSRQTADDSLQTVVGGPKSAVGGQGVGTTEVVTTQAGTIYSLNLIPLGGFVRPAGEDNPSVPGGLASASKGARFVVLAAGAAMNLLVAYLVFTVGFKLGWPDRVGVAVVVPDSPAQAAGLREGDVILEAGETEIHYFSQLIRETQTHLGEPLPLVVERDGESFPVTLTPREEFPEGQGPMGIQMQPVLVKDYGWLEALGRSGQEIWLHLVEIVTLPGRILRQEIPLATARPIGLKGIYDLTDMAVETAQQTSQWFPLIQLVGLISVALAFTNLLPLPALDGGRILFVLVEAVRGRRISPEREGLVHAVGFVVLLALMVIINVQDFVNPVIPPR